MTQALNNLSRKWMSKCSYACDKITHGPLSEPFLTFGFSCQPFPSKVRFTLSSTQCNCQQLLLFFALRIPEQYVICLTNIYLGSGCFKVIRIGETGLRPKKFLEAHNHEWKKLLNDRKPCGLSYSSGLYQYLKGIVWGEPGARRISHTLAAAWVIFALPLHYLYHYVINILL